MLYSVHSPCVFTDADDLYNAAISFKKAALLKVDLFRRNKAPKKTIKGTIM